MTMSKWDATVKRYNDMQRDKHITRRIHVYIWLINTAFALRPHLYWQPGCALDGIEDVNRRLGAHQKSVSAHEASRVLDSANE